MPPSLEVRNVSMAAAFVLDVCDLRRECDSMVVESLRGTLPTQDDRVKGISTACIPPGKGDVVEKSRRISNSDFTEETISTVSQQDISYSGANPFPLYPNPKAVSVASSFSGALLKDGRNK